MITSLLPPTISPPFARYAHGVRIDEMKTLVLTSGQLALDLDGSVPEGAEAQAELCFANINAILADAGASVDHVVKISAFVTARDHMSGYMAARDRWLEDSQHLPASTLMIVSGFTRSEFVVEVEVVAALP